jgi:prepilin-type processing-associated H-X9-DG protein
MNVEQDNRDDWTFENRPYASSGEEWLPIFTFFATIALFAAAQNLSSGYVAALTFASAVLLLAWGIFGQIPRRKVVMATVLLTGSVFTYVSLKAPNSFPPGRRSICRDQLKHLGLALLYYEAMYNQLPPVATLDENRQPLHSWRTLILPLSDEQELAGHIKFGEPWNSPHNQSALHKNLEYFRCPSETNGKNEETSYVAIIGPGTAWQPGKGLKLGAIRDKPSETILLVEMKNSGIYWAEPRDLDLNALPAGITEANLLASISNHVGGFNAFFADGSVRFISMDTPWKTFMAMLTINGGETIDLQ